jgi:hypothetical protein
MDYINPKQLEDNCYKKTKETVSIKLTDHTRQELEHKFAELSKDMKNKTDFIDDIKDLMNLDDSDMIKDSIIQLVEVTEFSLSGVKTLKKQIADILNNLKNGFVQEETIVYWIDDRDSGEMIIYLADGNFYEKRKFSEDDRQTTLKMVV